MKKTLSLAGLILCAAGILSISIPVYGSSGADHSGITIAYSGCVLGYLEPCG